MCSDCETDTYEIMECCASGSCEVCGGIQGQVRSAVKRSNHGRPDTFRTPDDEIRILR